MNVIKRNGNIVKFDRNKIINAVNSAFKEVDGKSNPDLATLIANTIEVCDRDEIDVEQIQDMVEDSLMASNRKDIARAYIRYRYKKEVAREKRDDFIEAVKEKLFATDVQNQNANVDERSFGGRLGEASGVVTRKLALDEMVSETTRENHISNLVYLHDLDHYILGDHNCINLPIDDLLKNGFKTRQTDLRPANSVNTAFQLVAVLFQLQSLCQFGGCAASHLDWTMVPYVRKSFYKHFKAGMTYIEDMNSYFVASFYDELVNEREKYIELSIEDPIYQRYEDAYNYAVDMLEREVYQGVEAMYHNLSIWVD